jgi:hypothetical protein
MGHNKAASTLHFRDELKKIQIAPRDERVSSGIYGRPVKGGDRPGTIYVLTHVDVFPPYEVDCLALLDTMSIGTSQDDGNIGYEVLQEADHPNHFTVIEEWTTRRSLDAISWRLTRAPFAKGSRPWKARSMTRGYTTSWTDCSAMQPRGSAALSRLGTTLCLYSRSVTVFWCSIGPSPLR